MKLSDILQKALPFGYLFLVIIGILKESVLYYQVGINILKYSSIMDILISPIADLTSHPLILFACIGFIFAIFLTTLFLASNYQKKWMGKFMGSKKPSSDFTADEVKMRFGKLFLGMFALGLLSFFLGIGVGNGSKLAHKISSNQLEYPYALTFITGEFKEVYIIGNNSSHYFYVEKGSKTVKISPVSAIKTVEIVKNKRLN